MTLKIVSSNQFRKDLKRAIKRGKKMERLKTVVDTLAACQPFEAKYRDHRLTGDYRGF